MYEEDVAVSEARSGDLQKNELKSWFDPLDKRLAADRSIAPGQDDIRTLLEMGKFAAATSPQRHVALLTAFAVGRALGRAEGHDPFLRPSAFLHEALDIVRHPERRIDGRHGPSGRARA